MADRDERCRECDPYTAAILFGVPFDLDRRAVSKNEREEWRKAAVEFLAEQRRNQFRLVTEDGMTRNEEPERFPAVVGLPTEALRYVEHFLWLSADKPGRVEGECYAAIEDEEGGGIHLLTPTDEEISRWSRMCGRQLIKGISPHG
jgi:hypothetical protein